MACLLIYVFWLLNIGLLLERRDVINIFLHRISQSSTLKWATLVSRWENNVSWPQPSSLPWKGSRSLSRTGGFCFCAYWPLRGKKTYYHFVKKNSWLYGEKTCTSSKLSAFKVKQVDHVKLGLHIQNEYSITISVYGIQIVQRFLRNYKHHLNIFLSRWSGMF